MWSVKQILHAILLIIMSVIFWYFMISIPKENEKLKQANIIRETITKQVNKTRLFKAVEVNNKLKAEYEITDDFTDNCDSNCTTKL